MPKKPASENSKKAAGNAKKAAAAAAKAEVGDQKRAAAENADWAKGAKSSAKKDAEAEKKAEAARKKAEKEALLKTEMESIKNAKPSAAKDKSTKLKPSPPKQQQQQQQQQQQLQGIDAALSTIDQALPTLAASGIDDALDALDITAGTHLKEIDRHPERRVKAAYASYEERRLPALKIEHPGLRMTQMKEMLRKEFDKSPENPMNQSRNVSYDATKEEIATKRALVREDVVNRLAASSSSSPGRNRF